MPALCAQTASSTDKAGKWGICANAALANDMNQFLSRDNLQEKNAWTYPGIFYYFTNDLSLDLGLYYADIHYRDKTRAYTNSVYAKALYNLGDGVVIPHVGFEYIKTIGNDTAVDYTQISESLIIGCEFRPIDDFSLIMDLRALSNVAYSYRGYSEYGSSTCLMPVLSLRWYL